MSTFGFVSHQCVGHLARKIGNGSVVVTMSTSTKEATTIDRTSFVIQLTNAQGEAKSIDLPAATPKISGERAEFQWLLPADERPASAVLSMWQYDGTRFDLELALAIQGAA